MDMLIISGTLFFLYTTVFSIYNYWSVHEDTVGHTWHILQFTSQITLALAAIVFGLWLPKFNWHDFGNGSVFYLVGIIEYIVVLRIIQKWRKSDGKKYM